MNQNLDNLLIHIGYHKTATTWLQKRLFISKNRVFEPVSKNDIGHSTLTEYFIYDDEGYLLSPFDYNEVRIQNEVEVIKSSKNKFESKIPVISHERLSGDPHSGGFDAKKIALMLKKYFPESKILIIIREQKSFILSNYFQYLSMGGTNSLEKYLNTKYDGIRPFFTPNHIKYLPLITEYYNLYGEENVLVLPYEMFRDKPSLFIDNFSRFLNVEISVEKDNFEVVLNKKQFHFVIYYMRFLNIFRRCSSVNNYSQFSNKHTRKVINIIFKTMGTLLPSQLDTLLKEKLKLKICKWCGNRYVESNKELRKLIGIDLSKYGYY